MYNSKIHINYYWGEDPEEFEIKTNPDYRFSWYKAVYSGHQSVAYVYIIQHEAPD